MSEALKFWTAMTALAALGAALILAGEGLYGGWLIGIAAGRSAFAVWFLLAQD